MLYADCHILYVKIQLNTIKNNSIFEMLENLRTAIREKFIEQKIAAEALGMNPGNLSKLTSTDPAKVDKIRPSTIAKIESVFAEYNINWILGKSGQKYSNQFPESTHNRSDIVSNGNVLGDIADDEMSMFDEEGNTKFYEISPGVYRMKVPLINETAKAGLLTGFADAEYIDDQEYIVTTVYRYHKGRYKAFRVIGDSMDVDRRITFVHGDVIVAREIKKDFWKSRFHTHKYPFYVFVTKRDGIIFKELIDHDLENSEVTVHSLNEDKNSYPDFKINLEDVAYIFNVVKREVEI